MRAGGGCNVVQDCAGSLGRVLHGLIQTCALRPHATGHVVDVVAAVLHSGGDGLRCSRMIACARAGCVVAWWWCCAVRERWCLDRTHGPDGTSVVCFLNALNLNLTRISIVRRARCRGRSCAIL